MTVEARRRKSVVQRSAMSGGGGGGAVAALCWGHDWGTRESTVLMASPSSI